MKRIVLILISIALFLTPGVLSRIDQIKEEKVLNSMMDSLDSISLSADNEIVEEDLEVDDSTLLRDVELSSVFPDLEYETILHVESIDLIQPVLTGATDKNLELSLSSLDNGAKPWKKGNYQVAGHRSRTYGLHFNRLDELVFGDILVVYDEEFKYTYEVTEKLIIYKRDFESLKATKDHELTLITCHPANTPNPDNRLIVKSVLVNVEEK